MFAAIDGKVPQVTDGGCPVRHADARRDAVERRRAAVCVRGSSSSHSARASAARGNLDRFDYWLNTFKYCRSLAQLRCALAKPDAAESRSPLRRSLPLSAGDREHARRAWRWWSTWRTIRAGDRRLAKHAAQPWPKEYQGSPRLIVPTVRTLLARGEALRLNVIVLDNRASPVRRVLWRPLGIGPFRAMPLQHVARAVYQVELPSPGEDFEYRIEATTADGINLTWPATAPEINQTVLIWKD